MRFAQIVNNKAHWVFEAEKKPEFAPNIVLVEVGLDVEEGWLWDGKAFAAPPAPPPPPVPTFEEVMDAKRAEMAEARWREETGGIVLPSGMVIETDDRSQLKLMGAAVKALQDPAYVCWWKSPTGWVQLDAATILLLADTVREHVQSCFTKEMDKNMAISMAKTSKDVEAIIWDKESGAIEELASA